MAGQEIDGGSGADGGVSRNLLVEPMDPTFLLGGSQSEDQQVGAMRLELLENASVLSIVMFEAKGRTVMSHDRDGTPRRFDSFGGRRRHTRCGS